MFEVGFSELLMIGLVSLLVIGPERLPRAARFAGLWIGKLRSTITSVKHEIQQELRIEEMRQIMQQQMLNNELQQAIDETKSLVADIPETSSKDRLPPEDHDRPA